MSVDWRGAAVIGCEVTGKTEKEVGVPACTHGPPSSAKFCPECGKPPTKTQKAPIDGWDNIKKAGLQSFSTTDGEREFIGIGVSTMGDDGAARFDLGAFISFDQTVAELEWAIQRVLEPLGLWDKASFGLWTVMYCSY